LLLQQHSSAAFALGFSWFSSSFFALSALMSSIRTTRAYVFVESSAIRSPSNNQPNNSNNNRKRKMHIFEFSIALLNNEYFFK
jgi:hypothetical protein